MQQSVNGQLESERLVRPDRILVAIDLIEPELLIPFAVAQGKATAHSSPWFTPSSHASAPQASSPGTNAQVSSGAWTSET